tara:strand:+ start:11247 stop:12512 length:1266 start_codon:yes stop_codon:yes gene_type:complete
MPMIQLIRKDGQIIELKASQISFAVTRGVATWPIPIVATRAALDLNSNMLSITIDGVITDDEFASAGSAASCVIDLTRATGNYTTWASQLATALSVAQASAQNIKDDLHGKEIRFSTAGQIDAGNGESIVLKFDKTGAINNTITGGVSTIPINIQNVTNIGGVATAIQTAVAGNSFVQVAATQVVINTVVTATVSAGANQILSNQMGGAGQGNGKITITNTVKSEKGNKPVIKGADPLVSNSSVWTNSFFVSAFTGGVTGSRKSKGDKVQDLLNMTMNASAGGGMISPQALTGDLVELPDSLSSFDVSKLLNIDESSSVKKYIVGLRVPYESMITAGASGEVLRQFIIPSGPGTDYPSEDNTEPFDPVTVEGGVLNRPNPFFQQKVAIPGVIQTFTPAYAAGDSVYTFNIGFAAVEQLIGI